MKVLELEFSLLSYYFLLSQFPTLGSENSQSMFSLGNESQPENGYWA
jgi:hypothetical protein